ncbi:ABC transporter ATP-binding protein [Tomitella gaofuii]|uniref:ABC transporter ATP-binding protein n=1 Tax=Tomitella gaofuii TaxID=2760083 RepID=UPI002E2B2040|nr:ABC transporter ATP-binding protein [Tomitella gaofuii]
MGTRALELTGVRKSFNGRDDVLRGVDLSVDGGELLVILGRSGSGKSTLLRVLADLESPDEGTVDWVGLDGARARIGMVFQQPLLLPWLSVHENIRLGGRFAANREGFDEAFAGELLEHFDLGHLAHSMPDELSGGQAQRIAIIRAAAVRPQALLLDEPFSALDPAVRADLQDWLVTLSGELGCTTILVTHDVDEALRLGDRIVLLGDQGAFRREWRCAGVGFDRDMVRGDILDEYRDAARRPLAEVS